MRYERLLSAYLWILTGSVCAVPGIRDGQGKQYMYSQCGGGRVLGGGIYKDSKVGAKGFFFGPSAATMRRSCWLQATANSFFAFKQPAQKQQPRPPSSGGGCIAKVLHSAHRRPRATRASQTVNLCMRAGGGVSIRSTCRVGDHVGA